MDFFPTAEAERGLDGVNLSFYLCLFKSTVFYLVFEMFTNEIFHIVLCKDSKQTKIFMKIQTCLRILKILAAKKRRLWSNV
jgi:hypothetical protein